jgi:hypothetical protein
MPTLYLHAGAGKTGTSYLQVLFAVHAERLAECGIVYPRGHLFDEAKAGRVTSGNGVEMANYIRPGLPHAIPDKDAFIHTLDAVLADAAGRHVLYSSEFLAFEPGPRTAAMARVAARHGYGIRVIYLVRDIAAAAASMYSQGIKHRADARTFADFITTWEPAYRRHIQRAVDSFGADSLLVLNYEEHRDRLAELFFRDILGTSFVPDERDIVNRSLSPREAEMLRIMNGVHPGNRACSAFVADALMELPALSGSSHVGAAEAGHLGRRFAEEVEFVNRFVRGRPIVVARHDAEEHRPPPLTEAERALLAILARLVAEAVKNG